jgi:alkylation response protein AidB-like acyl-CoA dehydrogenase
MITNDLLLAVDRLRPLIQRLALSAEADRQLSGEVYDGMHRAGLFAMMAPKPRGGYELPLAEACA